MSDAELDEIRADIETAPVGDAWVETCAALIAEIERLRAELTCDCGRKMYATCGSCDRDLD